jgi:hypothetical protein
MRARTPRQPIRRPWLGWWSAGLLGGLAAVAAACTNLDDLAEPDCAYTVAPTAIDVGSQGGTGTLAIKAPGVCAWTVENPAGWVSITGDRSGEGDGSLGYAVAAHEGFDYRYATLTVAGQSVTVAQQGQDLPQVCSYSVSPTTLAAPATGGAGSIAVAAPAGCAWTVETHVNWIAITSGGVGSGSGAFGYLVAANPGAGRTGSMAAGGQTISVTQAGGGPPPPNCNYSISPNSATFSQAGGIGTINVTAAAGCPWTAVPQQNWITILTGGAGSGNGQVQYAVAPCTCNNDRNGRIVVAGRNFDVRQDGDDGKGGASGVLTAGR